MAMGCATETMLKPKDENRWDVRNNSGKEELNFNNVSCVPLLRQKSKMMHEVLQPTEWLR